MDPHNRKLLQAEDALRTTLSPAITFSPTLKRPFKPNTPFDSSMALTILVLLTALFFMGFFSIYIRRFADDNPVDISRRRRPPNASPPAASSSSSSLSTAPPPWMASPCKGLDSSAIRSLPFISYVRDPKRPIIDCAICLSEFEDSETVKLIPYCRHVFHPRCIDTWLSSHGSCPLCRCTQLFTADEESGLYVIHEEVGHGASRLETRSTVDLDNTCVLDESDVRTLGMRRTGSCSSLGDRATLPRTASI